MKVVCWFVKDTWQSVNYAFRIGIGNTRDEHSTRHKMLLNTCNFLSTFLQFQNFLVPSPHHGYMQLPHCLWRLPWVQTPAAGDMVAPALCVPWLILRPHRLTPQRGGVPAPQSRVLLCCLRSASPLRGAGCCWHPLGRGLGCPRDTTGRDRPPVAAAAFSPPSLLAATNVPASCRGHSFVSKTL